MAYGIMFWRAYYWRDICCLHMRLGALYLGGACFRVGEGVDLKCYNSCISVVTEQLEELSSIGKCYRLGSVLINWGRMNWYNVYCFYNRMYEKKRNQKSRKNCLLWRTRYCRPLCASILHPKSLIICFNAARVFVLIYNTINSPCFILSQRWLLLKDLLSVSLSPLVLTSHWSK